MYFFDGLPAVTGPLVWSSQDCIKTPLQLHRSTSCPDRWAPCQYFQLNIMLVRVMCEVDCLVCRRAVCCHYWMTTRFTNGSWWRGPPERWEELRKRVWSLSKKWAATAYLEDLALRAAGIWDPVYPPLDVFFFDFQRNFGIQVVSPTLSVWLHIREPCNYARRNYHH